MEETPRDRFRDEDGEKVLHAMPLNDIDEHETSMDCWCNPKLDKKEHETGDEIVVHRFIKRFKQ